MTNFQLDSGRTINRKVSKKFLHQIHEPLAHDPSILKEKRGKLTKSLNPRYSERFVNFRF